MAKPTVDEWYMLTLVNRMRMNPATELALLLNTGDASIDRAVNDSFEVDLDVLQTQWDALVATDALAWSDQLNDSAKTHTDLMIANDEQSHNLPGEPGLGDRIRNAGYTLSTAGENIFAFSRSVLYGHAGFAIDWGDDDDDPTNGYGTGIQTPAGHRNSIMNGNFREIGIDITPENDPSTKVGPLVITQHLGNRSAIDNQGYLLGTAFRDIDSDTFYDPMEGLDDVAISITGAGGFSQALTSNDFSAGTGAYQVLLNPGTYQVEFSRNGSVASTHSVTIDAGVNELLDFVEAGPANPTSGLGAIVGNKYHDANNNGSLDDGELGLVGWTIYLDTNGNRQLDAGEQSTTTDTNGEYVFDNLAPGSYNVAEVLPAGWEQTSPDPSNPIGSEAYQLDNGETSTKFLGGWSADYIALNHFTVAAGLETIDSISVGLGPFGNPSKVFIYSDPNGDKNPDDAVKLAEVATNLTGTSGLASVDLVNPVTLNVGDNFFVGALYDTGENIPIDTNADQERSAYAVGIDDASDTDDLSDEFFLAADKNFLLRADATGPLPQVVSVDKDTVTTSVDFLSYECFLTGTLILTDCGEIPVETLQIGDLVKTADGSLQRIKWVGHQTVDFTQTDQPFHPFRTHPICIKAGALGHNLPQRDLYVSPDHALLLGGLLINAGALVNDCSIFQVTTMQQLTYHHVELEQHGLLLAEGTPAESYLPQNQGRETFDNAAEYEAHYSGETASWKLPMSFPRVSSQRQLPRYVRSQLLQVAKTLPGAIALAAV